MIQESIEDFRKRYKGTYLFLDIKNKKYLVRYEEDDQEYFSFSSQKHGILLVNENTARNNISFHFPKPGLYNLTTHAIFFSRYPARQWKRAPHPDNVIVTSINYTSSYKEPISNFDFNIAENIFFPKYPSSTKEAIEKLKKNTIAINTKFGISKAPKKYDNLFLLLYNCFPIGTIDNKNNTIVVKHTPLLQEVKDYYYTKEPEWTIQQSPN